MALHGNIVHLCVLMASKRRRWRAILALALFFFFFFFAPQGASGTAYLSNLIFSHAPLDIGFVQEDQKTGPHKTLGNSMNLAWTDHKSHKNEADLPLPKADLPVLLGNRRCEADLLHPPPKSTCLSFQSSFSSRIAGFFVLPRPLWLD